MQAYVRAVEADRCSEDAMGLVTIVGLRGGGVAASFMLFEPDGMRLGCASGYEEAEAGGLTGRGRFLCG